MRRYASIVGVIGMATLVVSSCATSVDTAKESAALSQRDADWSAAAGKIDSFMSFIAPDATFNPPGMPAVSGTEAIKATFTQFLAMPGFNLVWKVSKATVSTDGNLGYTVGTYTAMAAGTKEEGKYVTVWKKVNGAWMVSDDIFNESVPPKYPHAMVKPTDLKWGGAPPGLPEGGKFAVVSGDPSQPGPFVIRGDLPAGYRIGTHWHPTTENVTVMSGTVTMNMGEKDDPATRQDVAAGGYVVLPAEMRHTFIAKTATTIQVHGMGPFAITYVNAADDPRNKK